MVGAKGTLSLQAGYYLHVGSAFGAGGLCLRLGHHRRRASRPSWHIDYLRRRLPLLEIWYTGGEHKLEHRWAHAVHELPGGCIPMARFGASDCSCPSHLYYFAERPALGAFEACLKTCNAVPAMETPGSTSPLQYVHCRGR